jgi:hypothetical protein
MTKSTKIDLTNCSNAAIIGKLFVIRRNVPSVLEHTTEDYKKLILQLLDDNFIYPPDKRNHYHKHLILFCLDSPRSIFYQLTKI